MTKTVTPKREYIIYLHNNILEKYVKHTIQIYFQKEKQNIHNCIKTDKTRRLEVTVILWQLMLAVSPGALAYMKQQSINNSYLET